MAERALPKPGDTIADKYRIEREIGSGGMSRVFGATHLVTGKRFAIKWLALASDGDFAEAAQRFIREAQVAGRFQHPNVVEVYDVGETGGAHYMVMERLEGESLAARLERAGALSFELACEYLIPCMRAIDDAHAAGIVHRDLKPANIFICSATKHGPEKAKVLDFGIAKLAALTPGEISPVVTRTGVLIGTPYYLAPEQLRNLPADPRSDIYAFGVMMYQLLAGEVPFNANNFGELVLQIATATPRPLLECAPDLRPEVADVIARAMARDPSQRFQDLRALVGALEALVGPVPAGAHSAPLPLESSLATESVAARSGQLRLRSGWTRWAWVALAVVAIAGIARWYVEQQRESSVQGAAGVAPASESIVRPAPQLQAGRGGTALQPSAAELPAPAVVIEPSGQMPPPAEPDAKRASRRSKLRTFGAPQPSAAEPAPAPVPPVAPANDPNPLHMKIQ